MVVGKGKGGRGGAEAPMMAPPLDPPLPPTRSERELRMASLKEVQTCLTCRGGDDPREKEILGRA